MKLCLIFDGKNSLTSPFGKRYINGNQEFHKGIDLVGLDGKAVHAPCDATVGSSAIVPQSSGDLTWQWGNYVRLDTADGLYIFLCHLDSRAVYPGQKVKRGDVIGIMGNTGYSFGAHTHVEIRDASGKSLNPCPFFEIPNKVGIYTVKKAVPTMTEPEEEDMTGKEIYEKLIEYLTSLPESEWSQTEGSWAKATEKGIVDGENPRGLLTREQFTAVLDRIGLI